MGTIRTHRYRGRAVRTFQSLSDERTRNGGPGPGLSVKRRPGFKGNSSEPDVQRVALKAAQTSALRLSKRPAPSMPRMPWEDE